MHDTYKFFPTGGTLPNPTYRDYLRDTYTAERPERGRANGPLEQGLGGCTRFCPYLEEGAVQNIVTQDDLQETGIALYNCPSRRGVTFHQVSGMSLVDYAAAVGGPARSEVGDTVFNQFLADPTYFKTRQADFFGAALAARKTKAAAWRFGRQSTRPVRSRNFAESSNVAIVCRRCLFLADTSAS